MYLCLFIRKQCKNLASKIHVNQTIQLSALKNVAEIMNYNFNKNYVPLKRDSFLLDMLQYS